MKVLPKEEVVAANVANASNQERWRLLGRKPTVAELATMKAVVEATKGWRQRVCSATQTSWEARYFKITNESVYPEPTAASVALIEQQRLVKDFAAGFEQSLEVFLDPKVPFPKEAYFEALRVRFSSSCLGYALKKSLRVLDPPLSGSERVQF